MSRKESEKRGGREKGRRSSTGIVEIVVLIAVPVLFHCLIPVMIVIAPPYSYTGAVVMLAGLGFMMWAARVFCKAGTGFRLREGGSVLVTSGPFRYSRNPMYLGMLIWLIGFAVFLGSLVVFVFPVLFFLLSEFLLIPREERRMEQIFGERFTGYGRRVRRWL
ncbi:MAG: hypothetical protein APR53_00170 [Methanoculleus sp. SDB]|nr:MAG: hypothetical protein APR53_00170 [Methanoculleus sp. SDB]